MVARRPRRTLRTRLRADFDAGVSEVLGNVILVVMTVSLLGGFGALVLTTVNNDTPAPPAASFTLSPELGDEDVGVRLVSGSSIEAAGSTLVLTVNGVDITTSRVIADDPLDGLWEPGEELTMALSRPLAADDQLLFLAADNVSGKAIGTAYATVSATPAGTILVENELSPALTFSPTELLTDGVTTVAATIDVGSTLGLLLVERVTLDLTPIGGPVDVLLLDDGLGDDEDAGDGIFTATFSASGYDYPLLPGFAQESITATVFDVLGQQQTAVGILDLRQPTPSKAGAGVVYRGIGSSTEVGTTGYIDLAQFVLTTDAKLVNDEIELRISDLDDPTKVWSALVELGYDEDGCTGPMVRSVTLTEVSGDNVGSVVYKPTVCFEVGPDARLNVAVLEDSEDDDPDDDGAVREWQPFELDGTTPMDENDAEDFHYRNAEISTENEALIAFFGDAFSFSPTERGLSQTDFAWGPGTDAVPAPITSLAADPGDAVVDLSWTEPDDGGNPITDYNVYRNGALIATIPAPTTSYQVTGLTNGIEYTFRVRAVNSQGEASNSNAAVATPSSAPGAPPNLVATGGNANVVLDWDAASSGGSAIVEYDIYMGTTSGSLALVASTGGTNTSFTVNSLTNGVTYYFEVVAVNANGDGPPSTEASAVPSSTPGAPLVTATAGNAQVTLTWDAGSTGGSALTDYKIYRGTSSGSLTLLATTGSGANLSFVDATATNGVTYYYQVRATNANGDGALSAEESATPASGSTAPGQAQDAAATRGNQSLTLTWNAPSSDGGSAITSYNVYFGTSSGSLSLLANTGAPNLTFTVNGLTNGATYYFAVAAVNAIGTGIQSAEGSGVPGAVPYPPGTLGATRGDQSAALSWSAPPDNGGLAIINYHIYAGTSSGSTVYLGSTGGTNTTFTANGLTNGQTYYFNVTAQNAAGQSASTNEASVTPATTPSAPGAFDAAGGDGQNTLTWTIPSSGGSAITNFRIYRGTSSGTETLLASTGGGSNTSFVDATAVNGVTYYYYVTAVNAIGESAASAEDSATPSGQPSAPLSLSATKGNTSVALSWSAPSSNGGLPVTSYHIYRGTSSGGTTYLGTTGGSNTTFTVNGLTNGVAYFFNVTAANANGQGATSSEVTAIPSTVPNPPASLAVTRGNGTASLSWSAGSSGGSAITQYNVYRGTTSGGAVFLASIGTNTSFVDATVTNGVTYYYNVTAWNANGQSSTSNEASGTPAGVPHPPATFTATGGATSIALSWTAGSTGGSAITNYQIWRGTSSGGESLLTTIGTNTSYTDAAVTQGTTYYYQIRAVNTVGTGNPSVERSAAASSTPSAPQSPSATRNNGSVSLSWSAPSSNGGSAITGYNIYRSTTSGATVFLATIGTNTSFTDAAVTNGNTYYYNFTAVNANGQGASSTEVSATPAGVPHPPATFTATAGSGQVALSWTAGSTGGSAITGYQIWRGTSSGGETLLTTIGTNTSFTDLAVTGGTTYYYQIRAVNAVGTGNPSVERSATPTAAATPPTAPQSFVVTGGTSADYLSWSAPSSNGGASITAYKIYRSTTNSSGSMALLATIGTNTSFVDRAVTNNVTYYYSVRAVNSAGDGTLTSIRDGTPRGFVTPTCASIVQTSGSVTCSDMLLDDGVLADLRESSGATKVLNVTFTMNVGAITGTQTLKIQANANNAPEILLVKALNVGTGAYDTIISVPASASAQQDFTGSISASTYWPNGVLTIALIDGETNNAQSSWDVDFIGLVTT